MSACSDAVKSQTKAVTERRRTPKVARTDSMHETISSDPQWIPFGGQLAGIGQLPDETFGARDRSNPFQGHIPEG